MKKLIIIAVAALSFTSCGLFPRYSYMVQNLSEYDYHHTLEGTRAFYFYNDDTRYNIGDTLTVNGFKVKVVDARY